MRNQTANLRRCLFRLAVSTRKVVSQAHETRPRSVKGSRCLLSAESSDLAEQAVVDSNKIHRNAVAAQPASITNKSNTRQFVTEEKEQISREAKPSLKSV